MTKNDATKDLLNDIKDILKKMQKSVDSLTANFEGFRKERNGGF